ncbi:unnamed protein product, partial [Rhizopus stolonifer]
SQEEAAAGAAESSAQSVVPWADQSAAAAAIPATPSASPSTPHSPAAASAVAPKSPSNSVASFSFSISSGSR